jgi:hypothetical protein
MLVTRPFNFLFRGAALSVSLFLPCFNCYTDFLVDAGGPFNGPIASLNAGGWSAAYKAHGAIFGVAEVAVTFDGLIT